MWTEAIIQAVESDVRLRLAQVIERQGRIILSAPGSSSANAPSLVISGVSIPESDQGLGVLFVRQAEEVGDSIWSSIPMNEGVREIVPGGILGRLLLDGAKFFCHGPDQLRWEGLPESNRPAPWFVAENSAYRVTAATVGGISYSLAHNRIPIIKQFWIEPLADAMPPESLELSISLVSGLEEEPLRPFITQIQASPTGEPMGVRVHMSYVPGALSKINESVPAELLIELRGSQTGLLTYRHQIDVYAHNEWSHLGNIHETLAAFVQPNHPAISTVLHAASKRLQDSTGSGALQGYQAGATRAGEIAWALYEAMRDLGITYINPPASFEQAQKIRTPDQVLQDRFGTCLDTAVTYAACLEQAGLDPLLFVLEGHAFAGFYPQKSHRRESCLTDANTILNQVEAGVVVPVETTTITTGENSEPFGDAIKQARRHVTSMPQSIKAMIDIATARAAVLPLPNVAQVGPGLPSAAAGGARVEDSGPPHIPDVPPRVVEEEPRVQGGHAHEDLSPPRIKRWKTSLLDLSLRNHLLNFREGATTAALVLPARGMHRFEDLVATGYKFTLVANDNLSRFHQEQGVRAAQELTGAELESLLFDQRKIFASVSSSKYLTSFRSLRRKARALEEETGANHLFLTLGELIWTEDGKPEAQSKKVLRSPLLLIPINIDGGVKGKPNFTFHLEEGGFAVPNYSLLEKLKNVFGLEIPELMRPLADDAGVDVDAIIRATRVAIADAELPFRVDERGHLALLSFTTFRLWKDLDEFQEVFLRSPVVSHLVHTSTEPFEDPSGSGPVEFDETELVCPTGADGSQMEAIAWAATGRSFVLEGPPGTGKSQTITNMIAHLLHQGKTVLFVAEKQPALEVVQKRLSKVGLGTLSINLHGKNQKPAAVRADIKSALTLSAEASDAFWSATQSRIDASLRELTGYPEALHSLNSVGLSAWSAWETTLALGEGPCAEVPQEFIERHGDRVADVHALLRDLPTEMRAVGDISAQPWRFSQLTSTGDIDVPAIKAALHHLVQTFTQLDVQAGSLRPLWWHLSNPDDFAAAAWVAHAVANRTAPTSRQLHECATPGWHEQVEKAASLVEMYARKPVATRLRYRQDVYHLDLQGLLVQANEAAAKMWGGKRKKAVIAQLQPFLNTGQVLMAEQTLGDLTTLIADQTEGNNLEQWVRQIPGLQLSADWHVTQLEAAQQLRTFSQIIKAAESLTSHDTDLLPIFDQIAAVQCSHTAVQALGAVAEAWRGFTKSVKLEPLDAAPGQPFIAMVNQYLPEWLADAENNLLKLRRYVALRGSLHRLQSWGLTKFVVQLSRFEIPVDDADLAFDRGVAQASVNERLAAGGLDRFDRLVHDGAGQLYVAELDSLREQMKSYVPAHHVKLIAGAKRNPACGKLKREAEKARSRTSIRTLLERFGPEVQKVAPCFLMSPDSVARLINPTAMSFDVVILDEASQIKVAEAIGALGRGTSVVVVGDSRQMPPTSIAEVGLADDEDLVESDVVPADEESILSEAVQAGLPQLWLSWHYRSRDESLIAFSNQQYYDGRLASFPAPLIGNPHTGVHFRRIDGVFDRGKSRTNDVEARAIVAEVIRRLNDPRSKTQSIGVVTFNQQQQNLIATKLESCGDDAVAEALEKSVADERLFVKNLESVQGDERDVILFSLGFSRDPATGKLPLNFGPLNRSGGERRLNVAVTRARQLVILYCSFSPEDINLALTSSVGLAHLRTYLEMARANTLGAQSPQARAIAGRDLHRESIAAALQNRGLRVQTAYGLSDFTIDLAVGRPNEKKWRAAVLLDGPRWAERPTVADRDGFPLKVLGGEGGMGWEHVLRVWLPSWLAEQEALLDAIEARVWQDSEDSLDELESLEVDAAELVDGVEELVNEAEAQFDEAEGGITADVIELELEDDEETATVSDVVFISYDSTGANHQEKEPFQADWPQLSEAEAAWDSERRIAHVGSVATVADAVFAQEVTRVPFVPEDDSLCGGMWILDAIDEPQAREMLRDTVADMIAESGPIEAGRLVRILGRRYGMKRMSAKRADAVMALVPSNQIHQSDFGVFAWPAETDPSTWRVERMQSSAMDRPLPEVPPEEILNAIRWVLSHDGPSVGDDLIRAVLGEFGQNRLTVQAKQRVEAVLAWGLAKGSLNFAPSGYVVTDAKQAETVSWPASDA